MFGTSAVALFSTYRTIARIVVQLTGVFGNAVAPEFSRLFGLADRVNLERLWRRSSQSGLAISFLLSFSVYLAAPLLLRLWTHGNIAFEPTLLALMLVYAAVGGAWHIPRAFLSAVNKPKELAHWSILASVLVLVMAWVLGTFWTLYGVTLAMLCVELALALICTRLVYVTVLNQMVTSSNSGCPIATWGTD
jgi:O-antigen/teichoic acid export membrane protein